MKRSIVQWDAMLIASIVVVAGVCAQSQQAVRADEDGSKEGKIVRISPEPEEKVEIPLALEAKGENAAEPSFWIGISGRPVQSAVLRTHLQLAGDMGVVVEQVVPDSPAEKSGLRKHDIILRVNGEAVHGMKVLQDHVLEHQAEPMELKLIRLGKEETLVVVPEERPADLRVPQTAQGRGRMNRFGDRGDVMAKLLEQFQNQGGIPGGVRMFGDGVFLPGPQGQGPGILGQANALPNGVSVSIQRDNEGPAKITVKQGDQTWHVVGDDPKSLEQLPEELRPIVERMLHGQAAGPGLQGFDWEEELEQILPEGFGRQAFGGFGGRARQRALPEATPQEQELRQRMQQMEEQLQELQKRLAEE